MAIGVVGVVPQVAEHLHLGRQARHDSPPNASDAQEPFGRVVPRCPVLELLDATALLIERDRVEVHAKVAGIAGDEARGELIFRKDEPGRGQRGLGG